MKNLRAMEQKTRKAKIALCGILLLTLPACGSMETGFAAAAGVATSFIMTDKLPTDMLAEAATGLECSYVKHLDDGGPVCRSQNYGQVIEKPLYCYRSLGKVDCYDYPDPYGVGAEHIR